MNLFFDTSALIKFFHEEEGTDTVTELLIAQENEIWLLEIVRIEFLSSLHRRYRNHEINDTQLTEAMKGFEEELSSYHIEKLCRSTLLEAESLVKQYGNTEGLRTLDALHLGCFSLIADDTWRFVAADKNLCQAVRTMGFRALNPLDKTT
jgi:predicted nucleic acid-binding protein